MIRNIILLLRIFFFWFFLFCLGRLFFIAINSGLYKDIPLTDTLLSFWFAIRLDASMASYLCVIPLLFFCTAYFVRASWVTRAHYIYTILFTVVISLVIVADALLYKFWGQKLNAYAFSFAKFPKEMLIFSSGATSVGMFIMLIVMIAGIILLFKKLLPSFALIDREKNRSLFMLLLVLCFPLVFLGIRGGVGKAAINQSAAFYSSVPLLNHTSVNTAWNFLSTVIEPLEDNRHNPYVFTDERRADSLVAGMLRSDTVPGFFFVKQQPVPNVLFIVLEGWTADVMEVLGGEPGITKNFTAMSREGYLFDRFYANGNRTDKGLAAIFSAQPALANSSIINQMTKFVSLPSMAMKFKQAGYHTSFHYGGDGMFANMKGYWLSAGFEKIRDLSTFPLSDRHADWGVHDDYLYPKVLRELNGQPQPFFSGMLTLSSHEPFKVPFRSMYTGQDDNDKYRNSVYFSDSCLGAFMREAKKQPWYEHTLIIILSDHGHQCPKDRPAYDPGRFRIPFLVTGGALREAYRGKTDHRIANQVDLAATLLHQFGLTASDFKWSRDLTDSTSAQFATYTFMDGIGFVDPRMSLVFDQEAKNLIMVSAEPGANVDSTLTRARAYEQVYYNEYLKR